MELFKAHRQWAKRPDDERFPDLESLYAATRGYAATAAEAEVGWADLRTEAADGDQVRLVGKTQRPALLTHWAFGQLAARVGAPADYLRKLPATLASQNLNHGLASRSSNPAGQAQLLCHLNGDMLVRALTSDKYSRIWNHEIAERLLALRELGWEPAVPDFNHGATVQTALYASDHDMFAFLRNRNLTIEEKGANAGAVYRGVIAENSEVGSAALKLTRFLYREMCGNHIIWGASDLIELSLRHVGSITEKIRQWEIALVEYANESSRDEEAMIARAQQTTIAATKDAVLDRLFGVKSLDLSRKTLAAAYDAVVEDQDGDPRTPWGFVQGLTRHSQTVPYADKRTELDRAAGKVLRIAF